MNINLQVSEEMVKQHPELQYLHQQIKVNEAEVQLEKSKLLPDLLIGYTNQSMKNLNNNRFNAVQIGIGIPLFTKGQRALAKATKAKVAISENQYQLKEIELKNRFGQQVTLYTNQLKIVENYEQKQLPKSETILKTAQKQMEVGEIDYLDWVILTNQAVKTKVDYIDNLESSIKSARNLISYYQNNSEMYLKNIAIFSLSLILTLSSCSGKKRRKNGVRKHKIQREGPKYGSIVRSANKIGWFNNNNDSGKNNAKTRSPKWESRNCTVSYQFGFQHYGRSY
jgi:hypothetical protein